ncbi:YcjF family protein [Dokdonella sp. MW10]|uniref:YcjF family protein n=1 Tax=Dokdonella sp. MW10 TaxID=2992926 RepID=UPI003F7FF24F
MNDNEQKAILTLALMAAFADGDKDERERAEVKRIADALAGEGSINVAALYQDVLLKRVSIADSVALLGSAESRQLAYEMAVCVCDADGTQSPAEKAFLGNLREALGFGAQQVKEVDDQAEAIAALPLAATGAAAYSATAAESASDAPPVGATSTMGEAEMDKTILNASILNGALELLPESLATMAIIPLQMKLVYRIGKSYGYELDRGHVKDFLATAGVGLTSQYLEQAGRKLLGGLLGKLGGGLLRGVGRQAVSSGMSFASTYALGHVAKRYYAGGRTLSTAMLRESFQGMLGEAKGLSSRYLPQMQQQASTLDVGSILQTVRNG